MQIGKTIFEYNGSEYRLTGFFVIFRSKENELMEYVPCSQEDANAVSGVCACGCMVYLKDIKVLDREISHDTFLYQEERHALRVERESDAETIKRIKSYKSTMTSRGYKISKTRAFNKKLDNHFN